MNSQFLCCEVIHLIWFLEKPCIYYILRYPNSSVRGTKILNTQLPDFEYPCFKFGVIKFNKLLHLQNSENLSHSTVLPSVSILILFGGISFTSHFSKSWPISKIYNFWRPLIEVHFLIQFVYSNNSSNSVSFLVTVRLNYADVTNMWEALQHNRLSLWTNTYLLHG